MCLVSGHIYSDCQASHIVPWSRSDVCIFTLSLSCSSQVKEHLRFQVYELIDGDADETYNSKAGLLLDSRLHHEFDALKWSLYFKVG